MATPKGSNSHFWYNEPQGTVAGIGSRRLPRTESELMFKAVFISVLMDGVAYASGGAAGSDTTTEHGVRAALAVMAQDSGQFDQLLSKFLAVYLPGKFFNGRSETAPGMVNAATLPKAEEAIALANEVHPAGEKPGDPPGKPKLKPYVLNLHARNGHQVLGRDLATHVRSILCYTPDGAKGSRITSSTGGTGQALRLAHKFGIPVMNIGNPADRAKLQAWVDKRSLLLSSRYGIDVDQTYHDYASNYSAGLPHHIGDLLADAESLELDLLVQGCNCQNTMGSGIAKAIKEAYPEAFLADQQTTRGDKNKLGTYTEATVERSGRPLTVINAYTQFNYGYDGKLYFDYSAFEKVLKALNQEYPGKRVGFPRIGAERAGGCWLTIAEMIKNHGRRLKPIIVTRPEDMEYKPKPSPKIWDHPSQGTLEL